MKQTFAVILLVGIIICFNTGVCAMEENMKNIFVNSLVMKIGSDTAYTRSLNTLLDYSNKEVVPFKENGTTYVPLRFVIEHQGGRVKWNAETQTVVIYYADKQYRWNGRTLIVDGQQVSLKKPCILSDGRWYIPIVEWNDCLLEKQLTLRGEYVILSPVGVDITEDFYSLIDRYYREYPSKHEKLLTIWENRQMGLIDTSGNLIIKPKYYSLIAQKDTPILARAIGSELIVITEDEEMLCKIGNSGWLAWMPESENRWIINYAGPFDHVYDITGDDVEKRVGEDLIVKEPRPTGVYSYNAIYRKGLKVEEEVLKNEVKRSTLKNMSGNILFKADLPVGLKFSTTVVNDSLMIRPVNGKKEWSQGDLLELERWGWLDFDGNLIEDPYIEQTPVVPEKPKIKDGIYIKYTPDYENRTYNYSCFDENGKVLFNNGMNYLGWASFENGIIEFDTDTQTGYMDISFNTIYIFDKLGRTNPLYPPD